MTLRKYVEIWMQKTVKRKKSLQIKGIEKLVDELPTKQQTLHELREQAVIIKEYLKYNQNKIKLHQDYTVKHKEYLAIKNHYEKLEESWISGQASILAMHLHDGKPCPVCGSSEHPNKADSQGYGSYQRGA